MNPTTKITDHTPEETGLLEVAAEACAAVEADDALRKGIADALEQLMQFARLYGAPATHNEYQRLVFVMAVGAATSGSKHSARRFLELWLERVGMIVSDEDLRTPQPCTPTHDYATESWKTMTELIGEAKGYLRELAESRRAQPSPFVLLLEASLDAEASRLGASGAAHETPSLGVEVFLDDGAGNPPAHLSGQLKRAPFPGLYVIGMPTGKPHPVTGQMVADEGRIIEMVFRGDDIVRIGHIRTLRQARPAGGSPIIMPPGLS